MTVSGRAPPSLTENFRPPGELRSTKSWTTASQVVPKALGRRRDFNLAFVGPGSTRSTSTSRLPEATTP